MQQVACLSEHLELNRHYRDRFDIETSYRIKNQCRIRSTTKKPALRLLFAALAFVLVNLWVYLRLVSSQPDSPRRTAEMTHSSVSEPCRSFWHMPLNDISLSSPKFFFHRLHDVFDLLNLIAFLQWRRISAQNYCYTFLRFINLQIPSLCFTRACKLGLNAFLVPKMH